MHDQQGKETYYIVDFYCHENKLALEIDGEIHRKLVKQDRLKDEGLNSLGIKVKRLRNKEIEEDIKSVIIKLKTLIQIL
jgi:very-short-patch-repair endonuclease